jgi:hypothetical protein
MGWCCLKRPIVDNAPRERRILPVNVKDGAQGSRGFVNAVAGNQDDRGGTGGARSEMPILGQQDPILSGAAPDEGAVGNPAFGNERVIPGRAQPPAEAAQHLIAQKPWHVFAR